MKLNAKQIGDRISCHLKKWEASPSINRSGKYGKPYYMAFAYGENGWVSICYINYQGCSKLRSSEAKKYLDWLDAGNIGRHFEWHKSLAPKEPT